MFHNVIAQVLHLYDHPDREKVLFRKISDMQWQLIEGRFDRMISHKIWEDPNPDIALQFKANVAEDIREFLNRKGLTANWILGGQAD